MQSSIRRIELGSERWSVPASLSPGMCAWASLDGSLYCTAFHGNKDHVAYREPDDDEPERLVDPSVYDARHEDAHPCIAPTEAT